MELKYLRAQQARNRRRIDHRVHRILERHAEAEAVKRDNARPPWMATNKERWRLAQAERLATLPVTAISALSADDQGHDKLSPSQVRASLRRLQDRGLIRERCTRRRRGGGILWVYATAAEGMRADRAYERLVVFTLRKRYGSRKAFKAEVLADIARLRGELAAAVVALADERLSHADINRIRRQLPGVQ